MEMEVGGLTGAGHGEKSAGHAVKFHVERFINQYVYIRLSDALNGKNSEQIGEIQWLPRRSLSRRS